LSQLFMGSGGGGGGGGYGAPGSNGGPGSAGGAIVFIGCGSFTYVAGPNGTLIRSRSAYGTSYRNNSGCTTYQVGGGGGAGSGGSIKIMSRGSVYAGTNLVVATSGTVSTNCPTLCAGGGACSGGTGGMGRIAVFYAVSSSGTSNPTFCNLVTNANCP
jgi:hypothetical protein